MGTIIKNGKSLKSGGGRSTYSFSIIHSKNNLPSQDERKNRFQGSPYRAHGRRNKKADTRRTLRHPRSEIQTGAAGLRANLGLIPGSGRMGLRARVRERLRNFLIRDRFGYPPDVRIVRGKEFDGMVEAVS